MPRGPPARCTLYRLNILLTHHTCPENAFWGAIDRAWDSARCCVANRPDARFFTWVALLHKIRTKSHQYIIVIDGINRCQASAAARRGARPLHEKTPLADFPIESTANSSSKLHYSRSNVTCLRKTAVYCLTCDCIRLAETAPTSRLAFVLPARNLPAMSMTKWNT